MSYKESLKQLLDSARNIALTIRQGISGVFEPSVKFSCSIYRSGAWSIYVGDDVLFGNKKEYSELLPEQVNGITFDSVVLLPEVLYYACADIKINCTDGTYIITSGVDFLDHTFSFYQLISSNLEESVTIYNNVAKLVRDSYNFLYIDKNTNIMDMLDYVYNVNTKDFRVIEYVLTKVNISGIIIVRDYLDSLPGLLTHRFLMKDPVVVGNKINYYMVLII